MIRPSVFLCSGADMPSGVQITEKHRVVQLDALDQKSNVHLRIENVTNAFARHLSPRLVDLLEIAAYVYSADCAISRDRKWEDKGSTETWARDIRLVLPVRDKSFWQREDV
jgi:hypothetical protein